MSATKQRICEAALQLFQEKGYDHVSLREIAERAGTTIGNLTHHFPQKDLLLAALQKQLQTEFPLRREFTHEPEKLLENLLDTFFVAERNEAENSFYYQHICDFYRDSEQARQNADEFRHKLFDYYYATFAALRDLGVMDSRYPMESYLNLTYLCVMMTTFWVSAASPYHDSALPTIPIADSLYRLLLPYLVQEHRETYTGIYRRFRG